MEETEEGVFKGEWQKRSVRNPNNYNLYICYKSTAVQISRNEIFLSSLKYGYIYNMETQTFTGK